MKKVFAMLMCLMLVMVYMPSFAFADVVTLGDSNESAISDDNEEGTPGDDDEEGTPGDDDEEGTPGDDDEEGTPGDDDEEGTPGDDDEEGTPGEGDNNGGNTSGGGGIYIPTTPTNPAEPEKPAELTHEEKVEAVKAELKSVSAENFKARSKNVTMKNGKKAVKITWINDSGVKFDGVDIFRSTKRYSGFTKKPFFSTKKDSYYNTAIESGKTYYYKVRGYVMVDNEKVYTAWSSKAWRTIE